MFALITLALLFLTILVLFVLRFWKRGTPYSWLAAVTGTFLAWASVFLWQLGLPSSVFLPDWLASPIFSFSPGFYVDSVAWVFALALCSLGLGVILTAPARPQLVSPIAWAGTLSMVTMGIVAVLADSPLALVMVWVAFDFVEFTNTIRLTRTAAMAEQAVIAFSIRVFGSAVAMWAIVINVASGTGQFWAISATQVGFFLVLAAGLRLGVLPLHITYVSEPDLRRGFGTTLRLVTAASSLALLARFPAYGISVPAQIFLLLLAALAALYGAWKWFTGLEALTARPYWIIGVGGLAMGSVLQENAVGVTAWVAIMILLGGISFLYSAKQVWISRILALGAIFALTLPFTITAVAWQAEVNALGFLFWLLFLPAQILLAAGFVKHLLTKDNESLLINLPSWAQVAYPAGLVVIFIPLIVLSVWGWDGALHIGNWLVSLIVAVLFTSLLFFVYRFSVLQTLNATNQIQGSSRFSMLQQAVIKFAMSGYTLLGRFLGFVSDLFEGDGSLLWTFVLLVLFLSAFQN